VDSSSLSEAEKMARIADGRSDLVFDLVGQGQPATLKDADGVSLLQWCAYYGDVSAIRFLLQRGETLRSLGEDLGLNGAAFHGHWRLCQFLIENGADAKRSDPETGETALHSALSSARPGHELVAKVLLAAGADPNCATKPGAETGSFMRDCRTRGETPLHRAAAFCSEEAVQMLIDAGAKLDVKDVNGDSPLSWGSWHGRPDSILRRLCYGPYSIRPGRKSMEGYLCGEPRSSGQ
jgi:ankyrin repeat protein